MGKLFRKKKEGFTEEKAYKAVAEYFDLTPEEIEELKEKQRKKSMRDFAERFYKTVAEQENITPEEVEQSITELVEEIFENADEGSKAEELRKIWGRTPTNEEFIDYFAGEMKKVMK